MAERPTASESLIQNELEAARAEVAPERLQQLDVAYQLSASQCLAVGKSLAAISDAYRDAHEEDMDEYDLEEYVGALRLHAAALLHAGGETWKLVVDGETTLAPGGPGATGSEHPPLVDFLNCVERWETEGAELCEPLELTVPWPTGAVRERALFLAEEALAEAASLGSEPAALAALEEILKKARAEKDFSDPAPFVKLADELKPVYERLAVQQSEAESAAQDAREDRSLNERAYQSRCVALVADIALRALQHSPDIAKIFKDGFSGGRIGLSYPRYALEYELDRYCTWAEAGFDEIFSAYEHKEVNRAGAVLEHLLRAAFEQARVVVALPETLSDE